jgi:hypothetical protein
MFTQIQEFLAAVTGTSAVLAGPGVADGSGGEQQDHREEPDP